MAELKRSFDLVLRCLLLVLYIAKALDSEHIRHMCFNHGNKTHRPWYKPDLTGPCAPWKIDTCCSKDSVSGIERFNYNHCGKKMSEKCKSHFLRRSCFESCSPNLGPWVKRVDGSSKKIRFQFLPLCRSECETWWNDCKEELTCAEDWNLDFQWINGTNFCHGGTRCIPFSTAYKDATYFCEHVYGPFDFLVVNDDDHCMSLFDDMRDNHFVAWIFADRIEASGKNTLYDYNLEYNKSRTFPSIFYETTPATTESPEAKFMILFFFLGGILGVISIAAGCYAMSKCKPKMKRSFSRLMLFSTNNGEEEEQAETELS